MLQSGISIADIQWRMRLKHQATLEYYLQEVGAITALNSNSKNQSGGCDLCCRCHCRFEPVTPLSAARRACGGLLTSSGGGSPFSARRPRGRLAEK